MPIQKIFNSENSEKFSKKLVYWSNFQFYRVGVFGKIVYSSSTYKLVEHITLKFYDIIMEKFKKLILRLFFKLSYFLPKNEVQAIWCLQQSYLKLLVLQLCWRHLPSKKIFWKNIFLLGFTLQFYHTVNMHKNREDFSEHIFQRHLYAKMSSNGS